jgi:ribose transport system substrate-binding protein
MWVRRNRGFLAIAAASLAIAVMAACGEDSESDSASGGGDAPGGCTAEVKKLVAEQRAPMPLILPEATFDMSANQGKTVWFISPSQSTGYALGLSKAVVVAGNAAGIDVEIFDGKGRPDRFNQGFEQAVAQQADGIIDYAIDPELIPNALQKAKQADIPVLSMSTGKPEPEDGTIFESINTDLEAEGKYMADYAAFASDCEVNAATTFDPTYPALTTERDAIAAELKRLCPDSCETQDQEMKLATMATELGPSTQSLIQRNPDLNIVFSTFDQAATYQIPAVEQSGSDVKIVGTNGLPENLDQVRRGGPQIADVSYVPTDYFGWLGIDQVGRAMAGEPTGDPEGNAFVMPVQTFDKSNIGESNDLAELFPKLAGYQEAFKEKWEM